MKIVEYNDVDPLKVAYLTQLGLGFALTPEMAASIRRRDARAFPCLAIVAVKGENVLGLAGIFRQPMVSKKGREDAGGIWAVCTHPQYVQREVATLLIEEAHSRMREAGLRFSTLRTDRYRVAYQLYRQQGYEETNVWATAMARWETAHQPTRLRAELPGSEGYELAEVIYQDIARDYLGFAWRNTPFLPLRQVCQTDIWLLRENDRVVGYALARVEHSTLVISNLLLEQEINIIEAVAAVAAKLKSTYIQINASRPIEMKILRKAGFHVAHPNWDSFLIKPLVPDMKKEVARELFGIGTDRFLISWLDVKLK